MRAKMPPQMKLIVFGWIGLRQDTDAVREGSEAVSVCVDPHSVLLDGDADLAARTALDAWHSI